HARASTANTDTPRMSEMLIGTVAVVNSAMRVPGATFPAMSLAPTTFAGIALLGLVACGSHESGGMTGPTMNNRINAPAPPAAQSNEILERTPWTSEAWVKHILIGWRDLEPIYGAGMDPRARGRS